MSSALLLIKGLASGDQWWSAEWKHPQGGGGFMQRVSTAAEMEAWAEIAKARGLIEIVVSGPHAGPLA